MSTLADFVFPQAVIPTTGLFCIEEYVGDKLDPFIYELKASSTGETIKPEEDKPHKWFKYRKYCTPFLAINYNYRRCPDERFSLGLAAELAAQRGIYECWIEKLVLHIENRKYGNNLYTFINKPITKGTDAERFVFNYYKRKKMQNQVSKFLCRHLPLTIARPYQQASHLDWYVVHEPKFIAWLNRETHALVHKKDVKQISSNQLLDLRIESPQETPLIKAI